MKNEEEINYFKKEDLEFGDIITLRNKEQYIYTGKRIARSDLDEKISLECWKENLKHENMEFLDMMKIERYIKNEDEITLKTLYERNEILNEKEREYLRKVIEPFRDRIRYIFKSVIAEWACIEVYMETFDNDPIDIEKYGIRFEGFSLPSFDTDKYYKNMEREKHYTLEELGL